MLKPDGLLLFVVPYNNLFRRVLTNHVLRLYCVLRRLRRRRVAFTEFRYSEREIVRFVEGAGFRVEHAEPDDFRLPWGKALSLDLGPLVRSRAAGRGTWELNRMGRLLGGALNALSPWTCAAGILLVARASGAR